MFYIFEFPVPRRVLTIGKSGSIDIGDIDDEAMATTLLGIEEPGDEGNALSILFTKYIITEWKQRDVTQLL